MRISDWSSDVCSSDLLEVEGLGGEHIAGAAKAGDHLVRDEQDVVFPKDSLDLGEVGGGGHDDAAGTLHRLGDKGGDGVRAFAQDQRFQIGGEARRKLLDRKSVV